LVFLGASERSTALERFRALGLAFLALGSSVSASTAAAKDLLRPEVKKLFDEHLARLGQRPPSWVATALRSWAHLDDALRAVK